MNRSLYSLLLAQILSCTAPGQAIAADLNASELAASVKPSDVIIYTTPSCSYCAEAKAWLKVYGFAYTECDMSSSAKCESEFKRYGADGTPYLIVRGHHMKNGFDSDEFLAALQPKP